MSTMVVTLTTEELAALIRDEVKAALSDAELDSVKTTILTSEEAAAYLKMPVQVLRKRTRKGEVPSFKIGSLLRYRITELEDWLRSLPRAG